MCALNLLHNRVLWIAILVIAVIAIVFVYNSSGEEKTAFTPKGPINRTVDVRVKVMKPESVDSRFSTIGSLLPNEEVELRPEAAGKVTSILFSEGSYVRKGTLLVKLNDAELQAQKRKAEVRLVLARDKEKRAKQLLEKNGIAKEEYDTILAEVDLIQADVDFYQAQIEKTEIKAPFDGVVGLKSISVGSYVTTSTPIATFSDRSIIKIDFSVPQQLASKLKVGDRVMFSRSESAEELYASIYAVEPRIDEATRTLRFRARAERGALADLPGSFVTVSLGSRKFENVLMVPSEAVLPDATGEKVFVYKNGSAEITPIKIGLRTVAAVEVLSGVAANDTVIVSGVIQLRPKAKVAIKSVVE